jgi:hypothetical protein
VTEEEKPQESAAAPAAETNPEGTVVALAIGDAAEQIADQLEKAAEAVETPQAAAPASAELDGTSEAPAWDSGTSAADQKLAEDGAVAAPVPAPEVPKEVVTADQIATEVTPLVEAIAEPAPLPERGEAPAKADEAASDATPPTEALAQPAETAAA